VSIITNNESVVISGSSETPKSLLSTMSYFPNLVIRISGSICHLVCDMFSIEKLDQIDIIPTFGDKHKETVHSIAAKKMLIIYNDICKKGITYAITAHGNAALILYAKYGV
jgi:hypothetical protein